MEDLISLFPLGIMGITFAIMIVSIIHRYRTVNRLIRAFENKRWQVRERTIREVRDFLQKNAHNRLITLAFNALKDQDWHVRSAAAELFADRIDARIRSGKTTVAVVSSSMKPFVVNALIYALGDSEPKVRQEAAVALGKAKEPGAIQPLIKALEDQDNLVRHNVIMALQKCNHLSAIKPLLKLLDGDDRRIALMTLATLCDQVRRLVFGSKGGFSIYQQEHSLYDPDVAHLTVPMSKLKEIEIHSGFCQTRHIDALTHYVAAYIDEIHRSKRLKIFIYGNLGRFSPEFSRIFSGCKSVEVDTEIVIFGETLSSQPMSWQNPDCSTLMIPLSHLREIIVYPETYDFHQLERFLTYAVNCIGQKHLKKDVDVHIYGDPENLEQNLRNNFENLCRSVTIH